MWRAKRVRRFGPGILLAAGLILGAPGIPARAGAAPAGVPVGVVLDLSGSGKSRGIEALDALLLEAERINREGAGPRLSLVTIDSGGKPGAAAAAVERLALARGAAAVVGPADAAGALAAARAAERLGVPLVALAAPEGLLDPVHKWVFATAQPAGLAARRIFAYMRGRGWSRAAVLGAPDGFGAEGRAELSAQAAGMEISILLNESFAPSEHNFLPFLQRAHLRGVECFILWAEGPALMALSRARMALDLDLPICMGWAESRAFRPTEAGRAAEGVTFPANRLLAAPVLPAGAPGRREVMAFRAAFLDRYRRPPDGVAGYAADALRLLARALRGAGPDRGRIRGALETLPPYDGLTGRFRYSKADHGGLGEDSFVWVRVRGGRWTVGTDKGKDEIGPR